MTQTEGGMEQVRRWRLSRTTVLPDLSEGEDGEYPVLVEEDTAGDGSDWTPIAAFTCRGDALHFLGLFDGVTDGVRPRPAPPVGAIRKCFLCAHDGPWAIFSSVNGETICVGCRDARSETDSLRAALGKAGEEKEIIESVCPEDVGPLEYIGALGRMGAASESRALTAEAEAARYRGALEELRKRYDNPGHSECEDPKNCPWSETHEELAIIEAALASPPKVDR